MIFNISIKLREIGNITGEFMGATRECIFVKNAVINKAAFVEIDMMKIIKKHIVHISSLNKADLNNFRKNELNALIKLNGNDAAEAAEVLKKKENEEAKETEKKICDEAKTKKNNEVKEKGQKCTMEDEVKTKTEKKQNNGRKFKKEKESSQNDVRSGIKIENDHNDANKTKKNEHEDELASGEIRNAQKSEERNVAKNLSGNDELTYAGDKTTKKDVENEKKNDLTVKLDDMKINNRKSTIDEELKKEEKRVTSLIENSGDPLNMWSSVSKILVKKNELAGKINGRNEDFGKSGDETKICVDETRSTTKRENKEGEDRTGKDFGNANGRSRGGKNNTSKGEIEVADQNEMGVYKNTKVHQGSYKGAEGATEFKSCDKVISTQWLRCEKASDLKQNIIKKFLKFNRNGETPRWSRMGFTIDEKIKYIEKQNCVFPSKKKIDEIAAFGMLINQQKGNIFKKI